MVEKLDHIREHVRLAGAACGRKGITIGASSAAAMVEHLEKGCVEARNFYEALNRQEHEEHKPPPPMTVYAGMVEVTEYGWLHIRLNALLPHCRFQTPAYLTDTLVPLLDDYQARHGRIPVYQHAMLVIDEHCDIQNRRVFDQDNKCWKAIPNALKGRVVEDDDQFSLHLALLSTKDSAVSCHIYVMDQQDAGDFFSLRLNGFSLW